MNDPESVDILLVEDNPNDAELTLRALKKTNLGVRVTVARDGAEALEYLLGGRPKPKVIFLDLKLPKIDGVEVLRRARADERTRSIPVVVISGQGDVSKRVSEMHATFLQKPVLPEDLVAAMDQAVYSKILATETH